MTLEQAHQEFFDNAFHNSIKPDISDEAKAIAMVALAEKIERENPKPIAYKNAVLECRIIDFQEEMKIIAKKIIESKESLCNEICFEVN